MNSWGGSAKISPNSWWAPKIITMAASKQMVSENAGKNGRNM